MLRSRPDRTTTLFITLVVFSFMLTTYDVQTAQVGSFGSALRTGAEFVFSPVQKAASAVTRPVVGFLDGVANLASLRDENDQLRDQVASLEQELADTESLRAELDALQRLNNIVGPAGIDTVTARIFAVAPSGFDHVRGIDRGSSDGIGVGMPVVDESGLIGRVDAVFADSARVRLITDPTVRVGVRVLRTNETGWVSGRGSGPLVLEMFEATQAVAEGDRVVTEGGRFPAGLIVGTVNEGARSDAGFALRTTVDTIVVFSRLDFVNVLITTSEDELTDVPGDDGPPVLDEAPPQGSP
ncbi:MAG: rod shape-determining protein MreC [Acidimicrobiia bacterium]|nr:rod shape-determining protein MreC [Acidimicrobiia bacterium]